MMLCFSTIIQRNNSDGKGIPAMLLFHQRVWQKGASYPMGSERSTNNMMPHINK